MKKFNIREKIVSILYDGEELTALEIGKRLGKSFAPYSTLFSMENQLILSSRFIDGPKPRKRVYKINVSS